MAYLFLLVAIVAETFATSFLKAANGFTVLLPSLAVAGGYTLSFYFLSLALQNIPVGVAYAIWSGLGIVLISLIAWLVMGQRLDLPAILGMVLIVSGVICIKYFSKVL